MNTLLFNRTLIVRSKRRIPNSFSFCGSLNNHLYRCMILHFFVGSFIKYARNSMWNPKSPVQIQTADPELACHTMCDLKSNLPHPPNILMHTSISPFFHNAQLKFRTITDKKVYPNALNSSMSNWKYLTSIFIQQLIDFAFVWLGSTFLLCNHYLVTIWISLLRFSFSRIGN